MLFVGMSASVRDLNFNNMANLGKIKAVAK